MTYDINSTVYELFQEQALKTPANIAIVDEEQSLSYEELDNRSKQLAKYLISKGVCPEDPVGLCLDRSANALIAILGVLKAGAAFMPLDPHSPAQRLKTIYTISRTRIILTQTEIKDSFAEFSGDLILMDVDRNKINNLYCDNTDFPVSINNLAYIIHTSGTTGEPKGVALEHKPLANLILWHKHILKDGGQKTLGFMPLTFDVSIQEFFSTCCTGGTYYLTSDRMRLNPEKLVQYVSENNIERIFMTYTPLQLFIKSVLGNELHLNCLKSIMNVGEPLVITRAFRDFFQRHQNCKLRNQYGPTETTIMVTDHVLLEQVEDWSERPTIGKPIPNTHIYILDKELKPVGYGKQGEIFIGGICRAREYINRKDLTEEKFLSDPFSTIENGRMYRTGDLGIFNEDGSIQCLGRMDNQVKIRGFRVELGEIETALLQHTGIKQTAAHVFESQEGQKQLVAYVVGNGNKTPGIFELRSFLGNRLPDYMIPHHFMNLDELPMTRNGKLDRNALPVPGSPRSEAPYVPPRNKIEKNLANIWEQILKIKKAGINDNFFIMGGDSILAAQLIVDIENHYAIDIALATLYEKPTIAELGTIINNKIEERKQQEQLQLESLLDQIENMSDEEIKSILDE